MAARKKYSHEITVRVTFNRPVSRRDAAFAVWNHVQDTQIFANGDAPEPWETGKITVRRTQ